MAATFPQLIVLTGPEEGRVFSLPQNDSIQIGRSDDNQFALADSSVSRQHATVVAREGKYFLRDEHSRNGTILESSKLAPEEEVALAHLDEFQLGIYEIRFVEKPFTEADVRAKRQQAKKAPKPDPAKLEKSSPKIVPSPAEPAPDKVAEGAKSSESKPADAGEKKEPTPADASLVKAESLIEDILEARDNVEESLPAPPSRLGRLIKILIVIGVIGILAFAGYRERKPMQRAATRFWNQIQQMLSGKEPPVPLPAPKNNIAANGMGTPREDSLAVAANAVSDNDMADLAPVPDNLSVISATTVEVVPFAATFNVFLDVSTEPLPATVYFAEERLGTAPFKSSVSVEAGKIYDLYADFELRDINDIYRKKIQFKAQPDSDVVEIAVKAEIGTLKILRLPPRAAFYLEGTYDYDKLKTNPVKINDITYGKPIYLPYGRYIVELREQTTVSGSDNLITRIRYQREFHVDDDNPSLELSVTDKDLKYFPAVIKSDPSGADVYYNGEKVGATPFKGTLPIGHGELKLAKDGFFDKTVDVDMDMNSIYETTLVLETSKVGAMLNLAREQTANGMAGEAMNTLVEALKYGGSAKEKAEVYFMLGEAYLNQNQHALAEPYFEKARADASYSLRAALGLAKAYNGQKKENQALATVIEVLANLPSDAPPSLRGEANAVFKKVSPIKSVIYIYTDPAGADVYINDKKLSQQSPLILSDLGLGNYRIEIERPGFETYQTKQTLKLGEFVMVKARLKKAGF